MSKIAAGVLLLTFAVHVSAAKLYKCVDDAGHPTYQQIPCPVEAEQSAREVRVRSLTPQQRADIDGQQRDAVVAQEILRRAAGRALPHEMPAAPAYADVLPQPPAPRDSVAYQCTKPNGTVYYSAAGCGRSTVYGDPVERQWQRDAVQGLPGAVMLHPDTALDPHTGRTVQLQHVPQQARPAYRVDDRAGVVSRSSACEGQRAAAAAKRDRQWRSLSALDRRKLDQQESSLCD